MFSCRLKNEFNSMNMYWGGEICPR